MSVVADRYALSRTSSTGSGARVALGVLELFQRCRRRGNWLALMLVLCGGILPTTAVALKPGDILVSNQQGAGLIAIDPVTGAQSAFAPHPPGVSGFGDVVTGTSGAIFTTHAAGSTIYRVDGVTGASTELTSVGVGRFVYGLTLGADGSLYVIVGGGGDGLLRVDPGSGAWSPVASGIFGDVVVSSSGTAYVTVDDGGFVYARWRLYRIDLLSGARTLVSSMQFHSPQKMCFDASGAVIVPDTFHDQGGDSFSAFRVDPVTGVASLLASSAQAMAVTSIELEPTGSFILADYQHFNDCAPPGGSLTCPGAVYRMSSNGVVSPLSSGGQLTWIGGADIYRGPTTTPTTRSSWGRLKSMYR